MDTSTMSRWRDAHIVERTVLALFAALVLGGCGVLAANQWDRTASTVIIAGALLLALVRRRRWAWVLWVVWFGLSSIWLVLALVGLFAFPEGLVGIGILGYCLGGAVILVSPPMRQYVHRPSAHDQHHLGA
jgi:apolipoprotein N-acyltransferase